MWSCLLLTWPFQQLHSRHIPGLWFAREWPVKSLCRACVRAPLCNPALSCVVQRLEHGKELAFCKYAQCINNACPCAIAAGKKVCRTSGAKGYWCESHRNKHLIVVVYFRFCLFWCALRVENLNFCVILALSDKINILYIYLDYFLKDPTPCMSWKNFWNTYRADLYKFFPTATRNQTTHYKCMRQNNSQNCCSVSHDCSLFQLSGIKLHLARVPWRCIGLWFIGQWVDMNFKGQGL